ncbi:hypothetical protein Zm00014a_022420 [Zea mays]|uniref:Uncharacterized protein n=1 Tax=Zea mays TaxID=4577 RepID=A0A3L6D733_MAIZE|nr:hypothetical protein Zm00014a_035089 [Zea mays]PWZ45640.1 hypothetical protein Zm00014a_022420 [Zea mays]
MDLSVSSPVQQSWKMLLILTYFTKEVLFISTLFVQAHGTIRLILPQFANEDISEANVINCAKNVQTTTKWKVVLKRTNVLGMRQPPPRRYNPYHGYPYRSYGASYFPHMVMRGLLDFAILCAT